MIQLQAQACLDALAALGLAAYGLAVAAGREPGPLRPRLMFLAGLIAAFYAARSLHALVGGDAVLVGVFATAALTPIPVLLLAEAVLRRHAPRILKLAVLAASAVSLTFAVLAARDVALDVRIGLAGPIVLSLLAILLLLVLRDRSQVSAGENRVVAALAVGLTVAVPLVLTDFPEVVAAPIGMSPVAALLMVLVLLTAATNDPRSTVVETGLLVLVAAGVAVGLAHALALHDAADVARLFAIVLAGLIVASLLVRLQGLAAADRRGGLRRRLAQADTRSLEGFLADLGEEPLLRDLTILDAGQLADHDPEALAAVLARRPVWSLERLKVRDAPAAESEPLVDLLERGGATHIGLLGRSPLRVGLARLPGLSRGAEVEVDLGLAFRMARLISDRA